MHAHKIFLASSAELKSDREQFEIFISRKNKLWAKKGVFLHLEIWEDFPDAISQTRLQDEYNKAIRECDIFVMLFCTKVGRYTAEEFETAFEQFKAMNKPLIFTYFKDAPLTTGSANKDDLSSLWDFQEKLKQLGHFPTVYKNIEGLCEHFGNQLDKLAEEGIIPVVSQPGHEIPHMLSKPPFLPENFLGRTEELQAIKAKLFGGKHLLLLVNGEGGIGKTSLASQYYHTYQKEYASVAWLLSEKNIANALLALAGPLALQFDEKLPANERLDRLLTAMAGLPGPCLLVIDNANELDDLDTNYLNLRRCPNFHVLLTTRITEFSRAEQYRIEGLPEPEALQLFRTHYAGHMAQEDGLFGQLRRAVGGNTLVIELLAKNLHRLNRLKTNYALADLLADLQQKGLFALRQSQPVSTAYQAAGTLRKEKPEDIIAAMYDLGRLRDAETALLSAFAVLPAESIAFTMVETLLVGSKDLEENLLDLAQKGWIEHHAGAASFRCSPVVQEIAKKKNPQLFENCAILIATLTEKLAYDTGTGHFLNATYAEATAFAHYAESVVAAFTEARNEIAILCERIGSFHTTTGNLDKALGFFEKYLKLKKELYDAYPNNVAFKNGLAISYIKLGSIYEKRENRARGLEYYRQAAELLSQLVQSFPRYVEFKENLSWVQDKLSEK
ncbi:MAG: NB-ARC domain-containing protein [bacterium]